MSAADVRKALRARATAERARINAWFFKTGKGEYGEGDRFLGVTLPQQRVIAKAYKDMPLAEILKLLKSPWHEERLCALIMLVALFERTKIEADQKKIVDAYLKNLKWVNNWDLVDTSAHKILGAWLLNRPRRLLYKLARSKVLWHRRVAVVSTFMFIYHGQSKDTLALAKLLLKDREDLMHKAVGWGLREVGKRCSREDLRGFLKVHALHMPRTMLRYSLEHLSVQERQKWMARK